MDLLLWRHAQAVDINNTMNDLDRPLTRNGETQAAEMAAWLKRHLPPDTRILCSPALRTRQTVQRLTRDQYQICPQLTPAARTEDLLQAVEWPDSPRPVLVVGHQPELGRLAALLLSGQEADWTIKKGALWWFTNRVRDDETQTVLRAVIPADLA